MAAILLRFVCSSCWKLWIIGRRWSSCCRQRFKWRVSPTDTNHRLWPPPPPPPPPTWPPLHSHSLHVRPSSVWDLLPTMFVWMIVKTWKSLLIYSLKSHVAGGVIKCARRGFAPPLQPTPTPLRQTESNSKKKKERIFARGNQLLLRIKNASATAATTTRISINKFPRERKMSIKMRGRMMMLSAIRQRWKRKTHFAPWSTRITFDGSRWKSMDGAPCPLHTAHRYNSCKSTRGQ